MKFGGPRKAAFTLVEIMIVVAIIGLLAAIAIPNFVRARTSSQQNACINNLRQIDGAITEWALASKADDGSPVNITDVTGYMKNGNNVVCPAGGTASSTIAACYSTTDVNSRPTCTAVGTTGLQPHVLP